MCVYSAIGPMFEPLVPIPTPSPHMPYAPWGPVPQTGLPISPEDLATLLAAFHKAVEAAKAADRATGQPDCSDPEKVKLEERVAELERRLDAMTKAGARP
jgi:hypothetical protein